MTCKFVQEELVAYRDGELPEQDRKQIALHLKTCAECAREEAQLTRIEHLLAKMERVTPSSDFAANFWKRLEQEQAQTSTKALSIVPGQEHALVRWWRKLKETVEVWQVAPALAAVASLLIFFAYFFTIAPTPTPTETPTSAPAPVPQKLAAAPSETTPPEIPTELEERLAFYTNYDIISELERLSHLEEIAAIELPAEDIRK